MSYRECARQGCSFPAKVRVKFWGDYDEATPRFVLHYCRKHALGVYQDNDSFPGYLISEERYDYRKDNQ